jgi:hypothetical protein
MKQTENTPKEKLARNENLAGRLFTNARIQPFLIFATKKNL